MFVVRIAIALSAIACAVLAGYYSVTYAMSAVAIADSTFASSLSGEFWTHAAEWGVIAAFFAVGAALIVRIAAKDRATA